LSDLSAVDEHGHESHGKSVMRKETSLPLKFVTILGQLIRSAHDTSVVDEKIQTVLPAHEIRGSGFDTSEILEIELKEVEI